MSSQSEILLKLIDFIYWQVTSSCGDGDAWWYSRYFSVKDVILPLVQQYNSQLEFPWEIDVRDDKTIYWGIDQEWALITNDEEIYKNLPTWAESVIKY